MTDNPIPPEHDAENILGRIFSSPNLTINTSSKSLRKRKNKTFVVLQELFGEPKVDLEGNLLSHKKKSITLFLLLIGGVWGLHRLYLGYYFYFFIHIMAFSFAITSYLVLPDNGLTILSSVIIILWVVADLLAILFSQIKDVKNRFLDRW